MSPKREVHAQHGTAAAARRFIRATGRHVGGGDVEDLALLLQLRDEVDSALHDAARRLNVRRGYSWARIGGVLGISRQAAQQRFALQVRQGGELTGQEELFS